MPDELRPIRYSQWRRWADSYHGWRDGLAGIPQPPVREGPVTTPYRDGLIRLAQDVFVREQLEYLAKVAEPHRRLTAERARLRAATDTLTWEERVFDAEPAVLGGPEARRRRLGEEHHPETVIIRRRTIEHRKVRARAHTSVARARAEAAAIEAELARAGQEVRQQHQAAVARVVRIHEHTHRRLAAYRRALVRFHPDGAWANWALSTPAPEIPGWALPDAHQAEQSPPPAAPEPEPPEPQEEPGLIPLEHEETWFGSSRPGKLRSGVGYVPLNSSLAAPRHFTIVKVGDGLELRTHGQDHGPYIDGEKVGITVLGTGEYFDFDSLRYTVLDRDHLRVEPRGRPILIAAELNAMTKSKPRLTRMSFIQREKTLLAVLGPSGAGKSSLCYALLGELPVQSGRLFFNEMSMASHARQIRDQLGFVPQETEKVLHLSLTVRATLRYGFNLRSGNRANRECSIQRVLRDTDLTSQQNQLLCTLSGGQLRRVSIALELLTERPLLMLDEPTSGLDASMDRQIMKILRTYAEKGHTVLVVTHSTESLPAAHQVLVVVSGGAPAYFGPPRRIRKYFSCRTYADLLSKLLTESRKWTERYHADGSGGFAAQAADRVEQQVSGRSARASRPWWAQLASYAPRAGWRQFRVLVRRQCTLLGTRALKENDRTWWHWVKNGAVVALPFVVAAGAAALAALVAGPPGLGAGLSPTGQTSLALLTTVSVLSGQALTYSDVVSELEVIRREYRAGIGAVPVLTAKWLVFAALAMCQAGLITVVFCLVPHRAPVQSVMLGPEAGLFVGLAVLSVTAMTLGMLVSVLATKLEHAVAGITATSIMQIALNGVTSSLATTSPSSLLATVLPDRWGLAAAAASIGTSRSSGHGASDALWTHSTGQWLFDLTALVLLSVLFFATAAWRLHARLRPRASKPNAGQRREGAGRPGS